MNLVVVRILCLVIGYGFGLFQTAYIYGRMHGIDIREHGSGNSGTTNMMRTLGTKAGLITLLGDVLKVIIAVVLTHFLFLNVASDMLPLLKVYTGLGAVLGHNYPFYLNFKGGKGIAATAGMILSFDPWVVLCEVLLFFPTFFITHYVSLGSILINIGLVVEIVVLGQMGYFESRYGMNNAYLPEMYVVIILLSAMAIYKHRENITRLISGNERKTYLTHKSDS